MQVHITHGQLIKPPKQRVQQQSVGLKSGLTVIRPQHFLVNVKSTVEHELAAATESNHVVVERDADFAGSSEYLLDKGLRLEITLSGSEELDHGQIGVMVVPVTALLSRPAEDVEGEIGVQLGPQGRVDVAVGEARFEFVDPCLELGLKWSTRWGSGGGWGIDVWGPGWGGRNETVEIE